MDKILNQIRESLRAEMEDYSIRTNFNNKDESNKMYEEHAEAHVQTLLALKQGHCLARLLAKEITLKKYD